MFWHSNVHTGVVVSTTEQRLFRGNLYQRSFWGLNVTPNYRHKPLTTVFADLWAVACCSKTFCHIFSKYIMYRTSPGGLFSGCQFVFCRPGSRNLCKWTSLCPVHPWTVSSHVWTWKRYHTIINNQHIILNFTAWLFLSLKMDQQGPLSILLMMYVLQIIQ